MMAAGPRLVLASGSAVRARLLRDAGLNPVISPADIDEPKAERIAREVGMATAAVAECLATAKAVYASNDHPGALVIGADQMLDCGGDSLRKPEGRAGAEATLRQLSGRSHQLISAVCLVRDGKTRWTHVDRATLIMRALDDAAIAAYLDRAGDGVLSSVGAYHLEGLGSQLFDRIEGDYFTVLGLPLLPLLAALRAEGVTVPGLLV